jgi:hypothetical protein
VLGAGGYWSVVKWGGKMVLTLALRLIFPCITLELVLNCDLNLNFQLLIIFISNVTQVNSMVMHNKNKQH